MESLMALHETATALMPHTFGNGRGRKKSFGSSRSVYKCRIRTPATAVIEAPKDKDLRSRRPQNVEGEFYVDHRCIDCDTCRWMAPATFKRKEEMSAVYKQPITEAERIAALQALICCPTSSIHTEGFAHDILQVQAMFPLPIDGLPGIFHCGYHSEKSYGAAAFLITRPDGNILIDSPRYTERLAQQLELMGGVRYMFLTHIDDIADHERWHRRFICDRVMHLGDIQLDTLCVEMKLEGGGPWSLGSDVDLIYTPGHTEGSTCLLYKPLKVLFTGDHVALSTVDGLTIFPQYCQFSVKEQVESLRNLLSYDFLWIAPGHGKMISFVDIKERNRVLLNLINEQATMFANRT